MYKEIYLSNGEYDGDEWIPDDEEHTYRFVIELYLNIDEDLHGKMNYEDVEEILDKKCLITYDDMSCGIINDETMAVHFVMYIDCDGSEEFDMDRAYRELELCYPCLMNYAPTILEYSEI